MTTRVLLFLVTGIGGLVLVIGGAGGAVWATRRSSRSGAGDLLRS